MEKQQIIESLKMGRQVSINEKDYPNFKELRSQVRKEIKALGLKFYSSCSYGVWGYETAEETITKYCRMSAY